MSYSCEKRCWISVLILLLLSLAGCGRDKPVVILENISWPDGTVVTVIQDGGVADRSTLYGDYVRLRALRPGQCRIRAGGGDALTWLSGDIQLMEGENRIPLPAPLARRRIDGGMFGLSVRLSAADAIGSLLFKNPVPGVTTLTISHTAFSADENLRQCISAAHANAIECIVSLPLSSLPKKRADESVLHGSLDEMEIAGVDGVLLVPGKDLYSQEEFPPFLRKAASEIHLRGMTVSVTVPESWPEHAAPAVLFREVPAPEVPDMVRIAAPLPSEANLSPDTVLHIERVVDRLIRDGVPETRIATELALSAAAFLPRQGGGYDWAPLEPGSLLDVLPLAGMDAVLRLRDGTLRLGFRGLVYSFEDVEGLSRKLGRLHESPLGPKGGVHILYDGMGIMLDRGGLKRMSDSYSVR